MITSIKNLVLGYEKKLFSPTEITEWYLKRIRNLDSEIHSYITITEETALQQAKKAEAKMNAGIVGRLLGVPISYKDSIDTKGILTTNGSRVDAKRVPNKNADIVSVLEQEGTILLGKNNMYEYGAGIDSKNPYFGDIVNPWNPKKTAGGSSSGSAVAIATNLSLASIGTDTSGSIRVPASCCGVIGIKPTKKLMSMKGMMPLSWTLDHAGIITSNIEDTAIILQTLYGIHYSKDFSPELVGVRIGIPSDYFNENIDNKVKTMYEKAIQQMVELGATLVEVNTSFLEDVVSVSRTIGTSEMGIVHQESYSTNSHLYSEEMIKTFKKGHAISSFDYLNALQRKSEWSYKVSELFSLVDVIVTPTMPIVTPDSDAKEEVFENESIGDCMVRFTNIFNITGHPALSLPTSDKIEGTPFGLQIIADYHREDQLLNVGYAYEQYALNSLYADRQFLF
ncbi:amidase [Sporosarcina sp. 6E9]|uniref:amidase n=1 Tax=Sporosarcina sp. 6E9 TaxID=2819235 RepID=UPI001B305E70|nr:amidase [Sporosarcina sp. 6E9]